MSIPDGLRALEGDWTGSNKLWFTPTDPARLSQTTASVRTAAQGRFFTMGYTWADEGKPQDGLLTLGIDPATQTIAASWLDSFHMSHAIMTCSGPAGGEVSVKGTYSVPGYPDWGWRISVDPETADAFTLRMFNISPEGEEALAVEASYRRS